MDTAYVREVSPAPKIANNKVQETLHFRYLKFLVIMAGHPKTLGKIVEVGTSSLNQGPSFIGSGPYVSFPRVITFEGQNR